MLSVLPCQPVPVVSDSAAIVALASEVGDRVKRQLLILIGEHLQLPHTDPQVRLIEAIRNVPAKRPKLAPLLNQCVEETQPKQQLLPHLLWHNEPSTLSLRQQCVHSMGEHVKVIQRGGGGVAIYTARAQPEKCIVLNRRHRVLLPTCTTEGLRFT